jgi:phosphatidylinositol alpha-1,6-mannosyltransferase
LPDLYRTADLFVMPSTGEGFGIVFLQALACGVPVIGGDSDGSCDPLRDGIVGRQVSADDIGAVVHAIGDVIGATEKYRPAGLAFSREPFQRLVSDITGLFIDRNIHRNRMVNG